MLQDKIWTAARLQGRGWPLLFQPALHQELRDDDPPVGRMPIFKKHLDDGCSQVRKEKLMSLGMEL
jgi:hypothetical protein